MREMKDSGIKWIGEIPKNKKIIRNKYMFKYEKGKLPLNTNTEKIGVPYIGASDLDTNADQYDTYTEDETLPDAKRDDLLVLWDGARAGLAGTKKCGKISSTIVKISADDTVYTSFLYWYYKGFEKFMLDSVTGTTIPHMSRKYIEDIQFIDWNIDEQKRITEYLDDKCSKIDSIIEKQQEIIEKLREYKLSVITEAVTKGLNPDVEMKDSRVEWIGEIPSRCCVTRAGHLYIIILGKMLSPNPKAESDTLEKYYCAANVHFDGIDNFELKQMWFSVKEKEQYLVKKYDLLVVEGGAGAGGAAIVEEDDENVYVQNSILIVRNDNPILNKWLYYTLYSLVKREYVDLVCNKATIPHFTKEKLGNVPVVLFSEEETEKIVCYLNNICDSIDKTIQDRVNAIDILQDYKKSLIYEVVTGKKEV